MNATNSSFPLNLILQAEADSALSKIVRGQLNFYLIAWYQTDVVLAHFTRYMAQDTMTIL